MSQLHITPTYCGIGSRKSPSSIIEDMKIFAHIAASNGWILRSGGAFGADAAFEQGCDQVGGVKEIFLPWKGFNGNTSNLINPTDDATQLAKTIHPAYNRLSTPAKLLLSRNMHQILGISLDDPVLFVICFTPDGCEHHSKYTKMTGGTGTAISLASRNLIPVFNIYRQERYYDAIDFLLKTNEDRVYEL